MKKVVYTQQVLTNKLRYMNFNINEALRYYEEENNISKAVRRHCEDLGIEYSDKYRIRLSLFLRGVRPTDSDFENDTITETCQYQKVAPLSALRADGTIMSIEEYCKAYTIPFEDVRTYKLVTHTGKGAYYNIASNPIVGEGVAEFQKMLLESISEIANKPTSIIREKSSTNLEGHLLVVDPADVHIGKLAESFEVGEDYNSQIAVQRVREGIEGILEKAKGFNIDKILFVGGNDILHIDSPKRTTTSGTNQDTDGMWYSNFITAKKLYIEVLNRLLEVADVHFVFNPSNHDYMTGFFLADVIQTYFKDCKNITFDCSIAHRKYFVYGSNLIGTAHGDGGKMADLPLTMAHESPEWSSCKHRYFYIHHYHHKFSKDYQGVCVEALRSPSGTDSWHHRNQFHHAPKAIEGFLHHKEFGQIARLTNLF
jgi:hypothetical protein